MRSKKRITNTLYHIFMIVGGFIMLYPLFWLVGQSFKTNAEYYASPQSIIPMMPTIQNYIEGWKGFARLSFSTFFKNSIFIAVLSTIGQVTSCALVAFGFSRVKFKGRKTWFGLMLMTMMLPSQVLMIPRYLLFNEIGWIGTYLPILVPEFLGSASSVFMLMQFIRNIPKSVDEAAIIDGCNEFQLFGHIALPLIKPALATVGITSFMGAWSNFMGALLYLNKPSMYPVAYALKLFGDETGTNYGPMFAMSVLSLLPVIILFFIFQKSLVEGVSTSGIKG